MSCFSVYRPERLADVGILGIWIFVGTVFITASKMLSKMPGT